jgi:hypothetical protein
MTKTNLAKIESWHKKVTLTIREEGVIVSPSKKKVRYFVQRDNKGHILEKRAVKGSKLNLNEAREIYKHNKTFYSDRKRIKLTNVSQYIYSRDSSLQERSSKPMNTPTGKGKKCYYVSGTISTGKFKRITITRTSLHLGLPTCETPQKCKEDAWRRFIRGLGTLGGIGSDYDEGMRLIDKVKNIEEGWTRWGVR